MIFKSAGTVPFGRFPADPVVFLGGAVAGLTVDARLGPYGVVGVRLQVVVCGELAYMAAIACGVEGIDRFLPMDRLVRKVADPACRGVKPLLLFHIVGQRQGLQTALAPGE